jgi:hypothetical protein
MFLLFFFALVIFQGEVSEELGLRECLVVRCVQRAEARQPHICIRAPLLPAPPAAPGTAYGKMAADNNNPYAVSMALVRVGGGQAP